MTLHQKPTLPTRRSMPKGRACRPLSLSWFLACTLLILDMGVLSRESLCAEPKQITTGGQITTEPSLESADDLKKLMLEQQRAIETLTREVQHLKEVVETLKNKAAPTPALVDSQQTRPAQGTLAGSSQPESAQSSVAPSSATEDTRGDTVAVRFGEGVQFSSATGAYSLQIRSRFQFLTTEGRTNSEAESSSSEFMIRR